jgi:hypothetical protein
MEDFKKCCACEDITAFQEQQRMQTDKTIADTVKKLNDINKLIMLCRKRYARTHEKITTDNNTDEEGELAQPHIIFHFWRL